MTPKRLLAAGLALVALAATTVPAAARDCGRTPPPGRYEAGVADRFEESVVRRINAFRAGRGLGPVRSAPRLRASAQAYSRQMCRDARLDHTGSDGSDFSERARRAGYEGFPRAENIAWNYRDAASAMRGWIRSDGHRRNMLLPDVDRIGIGWAIDRNSGETWWTMVLGRGE